MKMKDWKKLYRERIRNAVGDEELNKIISDIYDLGFDDGYEDGQYGVEERSEPVPWEDLD